MWCCFRANTLLLKCVYTTIRIRNVCQLLEVFLSLSSSSFFNALFRSHYMVVDSIHTVHRNVVVYVCMCVSGYVCACVANLKKVNVSMNLFGGEKICGCGGYYYVYSILLYTALYRCGYFGRRNSLGIIYIDG